MTARSMGGTYYVDPAARRTAAGVVVDGELLQLAGEPPVAR